MSNIILPSGSADRTKLRNYIQEIVNAHIRMDAERQHIKDICESVKDDFEIPGKLAKQTASLIHKQNKMVKDSENEDVSDLYEIANG